MQISKSDTHWQLFIVTGHLAVGIITNVIKFETLKKLCQSSVADNQLPPNFMAQNNIHSHNYISWMGSLSIGLRQTGGSMSKVTGKTTWVMMSQSFVGCFLTRREHLLPYTWDKRWGA